MFIKPLSLLYLSLLILGLVTLAWPEENDVMMVQFSKSHGPSSLDLIGIGIILIGYFPLILPVFTKFTIVQQTIGKTTARSLVVIVIVSSMLIAISLAIESDPLLWISVAVAAGSQAVLIYSVVGKQRGV